MNGVKTGKDRNSSLDFYIYDSKEMSQNNYNGVLCNCIGQSDHLGDVLYGGLPDIA